MLLLLLGSTAFLGLSGTAKASAPIGGFTIMGRWNFVFLYSQDVGRNRLAPTQLSRTVELGQEPTCSVEQYACHYQIPFNGGNYLFSMTWQSRTSSIIFNPGSYCECFGQNISNSMEGSGTITVGDSTIQGTWQASRLPAHQSIPINGNWRVEVRYQTADNVIDGMSRTVLIQSLHCSTNNDNLCIYTLDDHDNFSMDWFKKDVYELHFKNGVFRPNQDIMSGNGTISVQGKLYEMKWVAFREISPRQKLQWQNQYRSDALTEDSLLTDATDSSEFPSDELTPFLSSLGDIPQDLDEPVISMNENGDLVPALWLSENTASSDSANGA